jgi:hypothetical protein
MSGNMSFTGDAAVIRAIAKRLQDPAAKLTLVEETGFADFIGAWTVAGADTAGFPTAIGGDVNGWNSLCRTNWFNGRFLTAEALRRQDTYFDYRSRLDAHLMMPGVCYGLGLDAEGLNDSTYGGDQLVPTGGFPATSNITLRPGLAFDMIGRPILVPTSFTFQLAQLISLQNSKPRVVVGGGTEFAPCICLAPDPEGPTGGAPAVRPGPYLLVIEAAEKASGEAKVYGTVCSDNQPITCQSEAWCAGFGLSLVRFPVEVPEGAAHTHWDLRGVLSAYYFDVFEYSLIKRWDPPFAADHGFCKGTGPGRKDTGAVALAMVYLGTDGSALFLDPWIPRRTIVDSPGEDWHRIQFGAPPRAACWGRIHQFQCMLSESLHKDPITDKTVQGAVGELHNSNLWDRGFRHIPPIGYLPIDPAIARLQTDPRHPDIGIPQVNDLLSKGAAKYGYASGYIAAAAAQARSYFYGTNVLTYGVVALHDDDILEDLANVFDKDPVQIAPTPQVDEQLLRFFNGQPLTGAGLSAIFSNLALLLLRLDSALLVNRKVEIVKLVVPLQGLRRSHPILGVVPADAADQAADWDASAGPPPLNALNAAGISMQAEGPPMLPRHFVAYVKQRLVLLDVLFIALEVLQLVYRLAAEAKMVDQPPPQGGARPTVSTQKLREQYEALPVAKRDLARSALAYPPIQELLAQALPIAAPDLAVADRAQAYRAQIDREDQALAETVHDPAARRQQAIDRVTDSYAAAYPGYQVVQLLAAVQPPEATDAIAQRFGGGLAAALNVAPAGTVGETVAKGGDVHVFATAEAAEVFADVNAAVAAKSAKDLAPGLTSEVSVADVLSRTPAEAATLLGGDKAYATFRQAYEAQAKAAVKVVEATTQPPPAEAASRFKAALERADGDPLKALAQARADRTNSAETKRYLDQAQALADALGPAGGARIAAILGESS